MRLWLILAVLALCCGLALAQDKPVQTFNGSTAFTTPAFQVQDRWEVRYDSPGVLSVTVLAADGSVAAGAAGTVKGSLYLPKGGSFTLQVSPGSNGGNAPWHITIVQVGAALTSDEPSNYVPPASAAAPAPDASTSVASAPATNSAPTPTTAPVGTLAGDQSHAVVVIKGDVAEGTGFLVRTPEGPAVVTNLHVISANPNVKIFATNGEVIKTISLKGASDRDLAMFMIQDDHYTYLDLATNIEGTVANQDEVVTPGNSEGGEVVLDTKGKVLGVGPDRIEIDNPIYHGNSGGPVIHTRTGKVIAVVTMGQKMKPTDDLDRASFDNKNSAITATMRYFGLRLDTVPKWEVYDWNRFLTETTFLKNFREQSRCIDSYVNGVGYERAHMATADESGPPDSHYWLHNDKLQTIHDNFHRLATDSDQSQKLDAVREEVMDLDGLADADMAAIQDPANFYSFDAIRAAQEVKYRKALRGEIDKYSDKVSDMGH